MAETENPCLACEIDQDCCRNLAGLKLTANEYTRNFARHSKLLNIEKLGEIYTIKSVKGGGTCPNWQGYCTVYETRSVECRIFPHTMSTLSERDTDVRVSIHSRTDCPSKSDLLMPKADVEEMVRAFVGDAYGKSCEVKIIHENVLTVIVDIVRRIIAKARTYTQ